MARQAWSARPKPFPQCASPPVAGWTDSPFFCVDLFEDLDLQRLVSHYPFQSAVLILEGPQPARFIDFHPSVFSFPAIIGLLADIVLGTRRSHRSGLAFFCKRLTNSIL